LFDRGETTANQIRELQIVAERHGWVIVRIYDDDGISGSIAREDQPAMKELDARRGAPRGRYGGREAVRSVGAACSICSACSASSSQKAPSGGRRQGG
jgi:hypothetical protein